MIPNVLTLQMLLHYYAIAQEWPANGSAPETEAQRWLMNEQLIRSDPQSGSGFTATEKGRTLISHILQLPMPVQRWEIPICTG